MNKMKYIITSACLILFAALTYLVNSGQELAFDTVIRQWFYSIRTPWLTSVVKGITFMGNTKTIIVICLLLLLLPLVSGLYTAKIGTSKSSSKSGDKSVNIGLQITKKIGVPIAIIAIVGSAINKVLKHLILRPRPDVSLHLIEQGGWSFPSGHSISSLLLYGFLAWLILYYVKGSDGKPGLSANCECDDNAAAANTTITRHRLFANIVAVILTLLWIGVGLSRIYLGVHYPTDVLGGWLLGMVIMMVAITAVVKMDYVENNN